MHPILFLIAGMALAAPAVKWSEVPLSFEPNMGQAAGDVRYLAHYKSYVLYMTCGETLLYGKGAPLRTKLEGADRSCRISGEAPQVSTSNYFVGRDPEKWHTAIPNFAKVRYSGVYHGIDLLYYGKEGHLEYDWVVSPGADASAIRMNFETADRLRIDSRGDLVIRAGNNEYRHKKPVVYQEIAGRRIPVAAAWVLREKEGRFRLGAYDHAKELVIDPPLIYSTYEGGSGLDYAYGVAVDSIGNTYVVGGAGSTNFPTAGGLQGALKGAEDVFVTKINPSGSAKIYSTYLGGGGPDEGHGIAVDVQGNAYITGSAGSIDFP